MSRAARSDRAALIASIALIALMLGAHLARPVGPGSRPQVACPPWSRAWAVGDRVFSPDAARLVVERLAGCDSVRNHQKVLKKWSVQAVF